MTTETPQQRLEYLRGELRAERISFGELAELESLKDHIEPGDVELLEAAGVPEFPSDEPTPYRSVLALRELADRLEELDADDDRLAAFNRALSHTYGDDDAESVEILVNRYHLVDGR